MYYLIVLLVESLKWVYGAKIKVLVHPWLGNSRGESISLYFLPSRDHLHSWTHGPFPPPSKPARVDQGLKAPSSASPPLSPLSKLT